jgi:conjugative transfer signal peptidase TraF
MPAGHDPPAPGADAFRRAIAGRARRRRRLGIALTIVIAAAPLLLTLVLRPRLLLVWNVSASAPVGLYVVHPGGMPARGDLVIVPTPATVRQLAAERRYLPVDVPLVKRVAAAGGDRICASGKLIWIDGREAAVRRRTDTVGRAMPWWRGCRTLGKGEIFLLGAGPDSFDGRYFGITRRRDLLGRAVLIWAKPAKGSSHG